MVHRLITGLVFLSVLSLSARAHDPASATYIANEGVLVTQGETKILFDPLFGDGFGVYQTVPKMIFDKVMAGKAPFDGVDAIFISHAHGDHFAAEDVATYMASHTAVKLYAPKQAVDQLQAVIDPDSDILKRVTAFDLGVGGAAQTAAMENINIEAVRIPHSGNRPAIENTVFRVTLDDKITVMHMGDATTDMSRYRPHAKHWQARRTDMAFPPYWLLTSYGGPQILELMNIETSVGTHVPITIPLDLARSGADYFSKPGETRVIKGAVKDETP